MERPNAEIRASRRTRINCQQSAASTQPGAMSRLAIGSVVPPLGPDVLAFCQTTIHGHSRPMRVTHGGGNAVSPECVLVINGSGNPDPLWRRARVLKLVALV